MPETAAKPRLAFHWVVLIALALGIGIGAAIHAWWTPETWKALGVGSAADYLAHKPADANETAGFAAAAVRFFSELVSFIGRLFLRCLQFIAVPIVLFSLVGAVAGVGDVRRIGRVGLKTLACFMGTLVVAVAIAVSLAALVKPGASVDQATRDRIVEQYAGDAAQRIQTAHQLKDQGVWEFLLGIIPANPFGAISSGQMLQVVAAAFLLGVGITMIPQEKSRAVTAFCEGIAEAMMQLVRLIMLLAPLAVLCLIGQFVAGVGVGALGSVLRFVLCVVAGLGLVLCIEYPLLMWLFTPRHNRMTPARFFKGMAPAFTLAFSSSSSSATLPVTIHCARDRLGVRGDIVNFVCPLGTTLNMDGTALYQVISVVFLAQLYGISLTQADYLTVGLMSAVVAVGTPGLPSASIVMMAIVLDSVGVPKEGIAIIIAVDRLLDMCRTIVNVSGDAVACVVVAGTEPAASAADAPAAPVPVRGA